MRKKLRLWEFTMLIPLNFHKHHTLVFMNFGVQHWLYKIFNLIEHILIKDFSHFLDHPRWVFDVRSVMHESLLNMKGEKWRAWRYNMIPWFTSGRMKSLFPQVLKCVSLPEGEFEAMTFLRQLAADAISTFFGIEVSDKKELQEMNKRFHDVSNFRYYKIMLVEHFAKYADLIGITLANRSTDQFFRNFTKSILFSNKEHTLVRRMLKLLDDKVLRMRKKDLYTKTVDDEVFSYEVTEDILISIAAQFFVAGLDTTSNSMTWLFYELASHPEAQSKAREEIRACLKKHGDWTYDAIHDMKYVAGCINESLRLHSPIPFIFRTCTRKYVTPDGLTIDKGTKVVIPALTLQMNPAVYPDPLSYQPERFIGEEKNTNLKWLPFGEGPRKCVGIRFSQMEMRTVVARLLENHELIFTENTKFPVVNNDRTFFSRPLNKLFVKLQKVP
uniref:Cytochrome P450 n=2 Tax=Triatoma infestans TaxID=30076 RepID=A0A171B629_TRIIF